MNPLLLLALVLGQALAQISTPGGQALIELLETEGQAGLENEFDENCDLPENEGTCGRSKLFGDITLAEISAAFGNRPQDEASVGLVFSDNQIIGNQGFIDFTLADLPDVVDPDVISNVPFDPTKKTFVVMHGWAQGTAELAIYATTLMNNVEDAQFIGVQWSALASGTDFFQAAHNTYVVAEYAGRFVSYLLERSSLKVQDLHLIGHGMACHGVGEISRSIRRQTLRSAGRITGLDCIKPYFELFDGSRILSARDAGIVEVVHTNGGELLEGGIAFDTPLGDIDFFISGGKLQPACNFSFNCNGNQQCLDIEQLARLECSHTIAITYFLETFTGNAAFTGARCADQASFDDGSCQRRFVENMGSSLCSRFIRGSYFMDANAIPPFAQGNVFASDDSPTRNLCRGRETSNPTP